MIPVLQLFLCPRFRLFPSQPREGGFIETPVYLDISALFSANLAWEESTFTTAQRGMIVEVAKFRGRNASRFDGIHKPEASYYIPYTADDKL